MIFMVSRPAAIHAKWALRISRRATPAGVIPARPDSAKDRDFSAQHVYFVVCTRRIDGNMRDMPLVRA
jgi:hypothetical protein